MASEPIPWDKYHRYRSQRVSAYQIAECYWLSRYPNLILVNDDREENIRWVDLSECLELWLRYDYPIIDFYKLSKSINFTKSHSEI